MWFRAKVLKYLEAKKRFKIIYDDKNMEHLNLTESMFLLEDHRLRRMGVERKRMLKSKGLFENPPRSRQERVVIKLDANQYSRRPSRYKRRLGKRQLPSSLEERQGKILGKR